MNQNNPYIYPMKNYIVLFLFSFLIGNISLATEMTQLKTVNDVLDEDSPCVDLIQNITIVVALPDFKSEIYLITNIDRIHPACLDKMRVANTFTWQPEKSLIVKEDFNRLNLRKRPGWRRSAKN